MEWRVGDTCLLGCHPPKNCHPVSVHVCEGESWESDRIRPRLRLHEREERLSLLSRGGDTQMMTDGMKGGCGREHLCKAPFVAGAH